MLLWAYKKQREIHRRANQYQGELALGHPVFSQGSKAVLHNGPIEMNRFKSLEARTAVKDIEYSAEDDIAIEEHIREFVGTTWHSLGTCKMAPRERGGVVDKDLNVYGVTKPKVVDMSPTLPLEQSRLPPEALNPVYDINPLTFSSLDLSICPENVGANTNNTALMIGMKAAAIIAQGLDLEV
ncbi:hypothetical protein MMC26_006992 [Xylographa opegraphella]|nr:hypothetical protein [Xylographa opegraphella]